MLLSKLTKKGQPTTKAKDSTFFENRQGIAPLGLRDQHPTKAKDSTFFENRLLDFIAERDPLFFVI
jgi:hypothetical protein